MQSLVGVGLRPTHYSEILNTITNSSPALMNWFEALTENYLDTQGRPREVLRELRKSSSIALHGVSLSIASAEGVELSYLKKLKTLIEEVQPWNVTDHLCWTRTHAHSSHDLLPMPLTTSSLELVVQNIDFVQNFLKRTISLENVSTYLRFKQDDYSEWDFLSEVTKRSGCGILLDLNNVYVNSVNHRFDPLTYVRAIPIDQVTQLHAAGYTDRGSFLFDTHSGPVTPSVVKFVRQAASEFPKLKEIPFLLEWDQDIPSFVEVLTEAERVAHEI